MTPERLPPPEPPLIDTRPPPTPAQIAVTRQRAADFLRMILEKALK